MLVDYRIQASDFVSRYATDVVRSLLKNINSNNSIRLIIKAEPNSIRYDNPTYKNMYDPKGKNVVHICKSYGREMLMAYDNDILVQDITEVFNRLNPSAWLLYVGIEWMQYEEQENGELKYKPFKEVLHDMRVIDPAFVKQWFARF